MLILLLTRKLSSSQVQIFDKAEKHTFLAPSSLSYYEVMLQIYYDREIDRLNHYKNIDEHLADIISFIEYEDEELRIKLIPGHTNIPILVAANINIPNTLYEGDYI